MNNKLSILTRMTPPSLPKGEEKSPFGGFSGSVRDNKSQIVINHNCNFFILASPYEYQSVIWN